MENVTGGGSRSHSIPGNYGRSDVSSTQRNVTGPMISMQLPKEWFSNLRPKKDGFSMETVRLPEGFDPSATPESAIGNEQRLNSSSALLDGARSNNDGPFQASQTPTLEEHAVFVEWRSYDETIVHEELQMALDARREQICCLFRHETNQDSHYIMQCLGYILLNETIMGLVFRPPKSSSGSPTSLNEMLRESFESASALAPDLEIRVALAKKLSTALYQLQVSGWLHRRISSHNVVFFPLERADGEASFDLTRPFLTGYQTARFDDQYFESYSETSYVWRKNQFLPHELPYVHPDRPAADSLQAIFRRIFHGRCPS